MSKKPLSFRKLSLITLLGGMVLISLQILPFTDAFITHSKVYSLFAVALLTTILFLIRSIKRSSFDIIVSPLTLPLAIFGLSALLSTFLTNSYPVENLLGTGGVLLSAVVIALVGGTLLPQKNTRLVLLVVAGIPVAVFVLSLLQLAGFGPAQWLNSLIGLNLPDNFLFNVTGSPLIALQLALVAVVGLVAQAMITKKLDRVHAALLPVLAISAIVYTYNMLPGKPAQLILPSFTASWSVALDAIRYPATALIGVGPESYANNYNRFKPLWVNGQQYWNVPFTQAANLPMTLLTIMGFLGLFAWLFIAYRLIRFVKSVNRENKPLVWMLLAMLVMQLTLPSNVVLLALFAVVAAALAAAEQAKLPVLQLHALTAKLTNRSKADAYAEANFARQNQQFVSPFNALAALLLVGAIFLTYLTGRTYAAFYYMNEAAKAALRDDAVTTYETQRRAVALNPYLDTFRRQYSLTNLLIAIALSNKVDATDQDKQQVTALLQQSINEARAATILDPGDTNNWLMLARIYENMIGATDEAENWAIQAYVNAIETNPMDPNLRIALGGIFLRQEQFAQAAGIFEQTVQIKPDFANSYYNLAIALKGMNQLEQAKSAYQQVLALLDANSEDYTKVTGELEELENRIVAGEDTEAAGQEGEGSTQNQSTPSLIEQNLRPENEVLDSSQNIDLNNAPATEIDEAAGAGTGTTTPEQPVASPETPANSGE